MNISFYVLFGKALYERVLPKNQNKATCVKSEASKTDLPTNKKQILQILSALLTITIMY